MFPQCPLFILSKETVYCHKGVEAGNAVLGIWCWTLLSEGGNIEHCTAKNGTQ